MSLIKRICVVLFLGKEHLGVYCSHMHQVPMVTCMLLDYTKKKDETTFHVLKGHTLQDYLPVRHIGMKLNLEIT